MTTNVPAYEVHAGEHGAAKPNFLNVTKGFMSWAATLDHKRIGIMYLVGDGVPKNLKDTVYPFNYNNFQELLSIVDNNDIGVIKMEVVRNFGPQRRRAGQGAVFVF